MAVNKLKVIQSYDKLSKELQREFKQMYANGYSEHLIEFTNAKGEIVSALPFETDDKYYLIKMSHRKIQTVPDDIDQDIDESKLDEEFKSKYKDEYPEDEEEKPEEEEDDDYDDDDEDEDDVADEPSDEDDDED